MQVIEKIFAAAVLVACLLMLMRMLAGPRRRSRVGAALRRWRALWARRVRATLRRPTAQGRAEQAAAEAIDRARRTAAEGEWDGNVYRPKSFKRKKRDLH